VTVHVDTERITARAKEVAAREQKRLAERTAASERLFRRAVKSMPLGVASSFQANDP
jgi:hypothetical protein